MEEEVRDILAGIKINKEKGDGVVPPVFLVALDDPPSGLLHSNRVCSIAPALLGDRAPPRRPGPL